MVPNTATITLPDGREVPHIWLSQGSLADLAAQRLGLLPGHIVLFHVPDPQTIAGHERFCNLGLWPAHHGRSHDALAYANRTGAEKAEWPDWKAYAKLNRIAAKAVARQLATYEYALDDEAAVVIVHDYQLMLVIEQLWASPEVKQLLIRTGTRFAYVAHTSMATTGELHNAFGWRADYLTNAMSEAHAVVFHSPRWKNNFDQFPPEHLRPGRGKSRHAPAAIDAAEVRALSRTDSFKSGASTIVEIQRGLAKWAPPGAVTGVAFAMARMEPDKGVAQQLEAADLCFQADPSLLGLRTFYFRFYGSRLHLSDYRAFLEKMQGEAAVINELNMNAHVEATMQRLGPVLDGADHGAAMQAAGELEAAKRWRPVVLVVDNDYERALGETAAANVRIVSAVRGGLEITAMEMFALSPNPVAVSSGTGAADVLKGCVIPFDPTDPRSIAQAVSDGFAVDPVVSSTRAAAARQFINRRVPRTWISEIAGYACGGPQLHYDVFAPTGHLADTSRSPVSGSTRQHSDPAEMGLL